MSMKNSNDTIGNRTHDRPACSALPQPIAPQRASETVCTVKNMRWAGHVACEGKKRIVYGFSIGNI